MRGFGIEERSEQGQAKREQGGGLAGRSIDPCCRSSGVAARGARSLEEPLAMANWRGRAEEQARGKKRVRRRRGEGRSSSRVRARLGWAELERWWRMRKGEVVVVAVVRDEERETSEVGRGVEETASSDPKSTRKKNRHWEL